MLFLAFLWELEDRWHQVGVPNSKQVLGLPGSCLSAHTELWEPWAVSSDSHLLPVCSGAHDLTSPKFSFLHL